ncbi:hypothetical protein F4806DRAFT_64051 [Annulohypoxylon nitens]|nr:hypothetical protein F4806DRAFT_64051 [Annulohypoxylon nitens]
MPRPLRSSCDRCHSQKLKCPKEPGVATCTRCLKAGTSCIFSPAGLSTRRNMLTPVYSDSDLNMNTNMSMNMNMNMNIFDWPPLDLGLGDAAGTPSDTIQQMQPGTTPAIQQTEQPSQTEAALQDPRSKCVRQLTALAVDVDLLSRDLSSMSRVHVPKNRPIEEYHSRFVENNTRHLCIEQLFTYAHRLINIYPQVLNVIFNKPDDSDCRDSDCFHAVRLPDELAGCFAGLDDDQDKIDVFLFNLLASCHFKVVDVMALVVQCARTCTQVTLTSPNLSEPDVQIPEVRVGNFVATKTSASTMQTVLLIHLAEVLVDYAHQLSQQITATFEHENSTQAQTFMLQCKLLEEKAASKTKLLKQVKTLFSRIGFMK